MHHLKKAFNRTVVNPLLSRSTKLVASIRGGRPSPEYTFKVDTPILHQFYSSLSQYVYDRFIILKDFYLNASPRIKVIGESLEFF